MTLKLITSQQEVLALLSDKSLRLSVWEGKAVIIDRESGEMVGRVQNGLPTKLVDNGLLKYDGRYEITEKGLGKPGGSNEVN